MLPPFFFCTMTPEPAMGKRRFNGRAKPMPERFDLVIRGGTIVTEVTQTVADIGIRGESIAAIGNGLHGAREIDATGNSLVALTLMST